MNKKKVLFIGVGFHEYDEFIIEHLKLKFDVWYLWSSKFFQTQPHRNIIEAIFPIKLKNKDHQNISNFIENTKECDFDIIFTIKGSNLTESHLSTLRHYHPRAKFVLYLWDGWSVMKNREVLKKHFSTIYSFDSEDCKKYGFKLRPLFYINNVQEKNRQYDVSFIGGDHSGRLKTMMAMKAACIANNLTFKFIVITRFSTIIKLFVKSISLYFHCYDIIKRRGVSYNDFLNITRKSRVVLDIHYKNQSGLTMRTIEALAAGTKIVTTNSHIQEYDNIPKEMYYIWDMSVTPQLLDFIKAPCNDYKIDPYYSVDSFLTEMLD